MNSQLSMHISHIILALMMVLTLIQRKTRKKALSRKPADFIIDTISLGAHFFIVPAVAFFAIHAIQKYVPSENLGFIRGPGILIFIGGLVVVDYFWYWNHRLFHADTWFWNLHEVHHNAKVFDVFMSCLLYTSPSPRDGLLSRMPSSA